MSEILNLSAEKTGGEHLLKEIGSNDDWPDGNIETGSEKRLDADAVIKEEKTWMETPRGKTKEIAAIMATMGLITLFSAGKATAEEIEAFVSHDSDQDKIEMVQKSESEIDQAVEAKIQEYLSSIPENVTSRQISIRRNGEDGSAISVAPSGENIFISKRYYGIDYANPQNAGNVINVERKSGEVEVLGHAKNIEAAGDVFTMEGYGATKEEALATALESAAEYMGTGVALDQEKNTENQSVSLYNQSERTTKYYIKSYEEIGSSEEERPDGEKFYTVQIKVQPGKLAETLQQ